MVGEEWGNENRRKVAKKERFKEVKKERDGGTALEVKEQKKEEWKKAIERINQEKNRERMEELERI